MSYTYLSQIIIIVLSHYNEVAMALQRVEEKLE